MCWKTVIHSSLISGTFYFCFSATVNWLVSSTCFYLAHLLNQIKCRKSQFSLQWGRFHASTTVRFSLIRERIIQSGFGNRFNWFIEKICCSRNLANQSAHNCYDTTSRFSISTLFFYNWSVSTLCFKAKNLAKHANMWTKYFVAVSFIQRCEL